MSKVLTSEEINKLAQQVQAIAQTGLQYSTGVFDKERYEALRKIAFELLSSNFDLSAEQFSSLHIPDEGYATPKTDVRAIVLREGKLLMVRESDDGLWSLPGGWVDVGDAPSAAVCREVLEETGLQVKATKLLGIWDRNQHNHPPYPWHVYKVIFLCEEYGGEITTSYESLDVKFFDINKLPELSLTRIVPELILTSVDIATSDKPAWFD
ncbi:NUDIX hydrolase [Phytobacter sp. V91]|uniref:NUDIX hydrolase n=1 Tax=Phytobacter sp. V91 TaxID=3369425 RepID=UPI003F600B04